MRRDNTQSGFTLIELVMVIVILGVLASLAIPKFVDLSSDAKNAAAAGVAGALASAAATNYAARSANSTKGTSIGNCQHVTSALVSVPSVTISSTTVATTGATVLCTITHQGVTANFTAIGIG
jgi:MSHA pilin protein MshA